MDELPSFFLTSPRRKNAPPGTPPPLPPFSGQQNSPPCVSGMGHKNWKLFFSPRSRPPTHGPKVVFSPPPGRPGKLPLFFPELDFFSRESFGPLEAESTGAFPLFFCYETSPRPPVTIPLYDLRTRAVIFFPWKEGDAFGIERSLFLGQQF